MAYYSAPIRREILMGVLDGKVSIMTASGRGIGRAVALAYGEAGASVVVAPLGKEESELTVHDIESAGGHYGDADKDIAPVAVFLANEASDYMTGQTFNVDGGLFLAP
jgi:NAD(P)-dependent dehydrogenase (short-subunit alcohol dehydrogenase family)